MGTSWTQNLSINWRKVNFIAFLVWLGPGALISFLFKDILPWTAFMSWYAIVAAHLTAWRADSPNPGE